MKPFELSLACKGEPLVTRNGKKVSQFHYFDAPNSEYQIYAVIEGEIYSFTKNGKFHDDDLRYGFDLFMSDPLPKKYTINIYQGDKEPFCGLLCEEKNNEVNTNYPLIKTILVKI